MRFSTLIKPKETSEDVAQKRPAQPAQPARIKPTPAQTPRPTPAINREVLEQEIRSRLESELQLKIEKREAEFKAMMEQKNKEEELLMREREKVLQQEQIKMYQLVEDLRKQREQINQLAQQSFEKELAQKIQMEREKSQQEVQKELTGTQRIIEGLQKEIRDRDLELQRKETQLLEEQRAKLQSSSVSPPKPIASAPSASSKSPLPLPEVKPKISVPKAEDFNTDPAIEGKARQIYEQLVQSGGEVFDQIAKSKPVTITKLSAQLKEMIALAMKSDAELIHAALEPYPNSAYFTFHAVNSSILAIVLALEYQFGAEELQELALAAFLHDAGLVNVREDLNYPKQLTAEIQKEVLAHAEGGAELLQDCLSERALTAVRQHHEICNGKGYPRGLTDKDIHVYAKILHITDVFEALTHDRPYRKKPFEVNEAMKEIIERGRGIYDQTAMKALLGRVGLYPITSLVELSNKQIARVVRLNHKFPLSPTIKIEFDEWGHKIEKPAILDLSESQVIHIVGPVKEAPAYHASMMAAENQKVSKKKPSIMLHEMIPLALVVLALLLLLYVVVKI